MKSTSICSNKEKAGKKHVAVRRSKLLEWIKHRHKRTMSKKPKLSQKQELTDQRSKWRYNSRDLSKLCTSKKFNQNLSTRSDTSSRLLNSRCTWSACKSNNRDRLSDSRHLFFTKKSHMKNQAEDEDHGLAGDQATLARKLNHMFQ